MNIKQHYCEVDQDQANEAREMLVKAGESVYDYKNAFEVYDDRVILQTHINDDDWLVDFMYEKTKRKKKLTYPQFKEMLNAKIKGDGK